MLNSQKRREMMLFNYETTTLTDYRFGDIRPPTKTKIKEKPPRPRPEFVPLKYIHTLSPWTTPLPFDTFIKPKEIIRENPRRTQQRYTRPIDCEREQIIKSRPRLVMTPAIGLDDIKDEETRHSIVSDMYKSDKARMDQNIIRAQNVRAPLPTQYTEANPIYIPVWRPPRVEPGWRMETVTWDRKQLRSHCDPTKEFWMQPSHQPTSCPACEQDKIVAEERRKKCTMLTQSPYQSIP